MTASDRFDRQLQDWLGVEASTPAPIDLHAAAIDRARRSRQRPGWLVLARGAGFTKPFPTLELPRRRLSYVLVALALIAILVATALAIGSSQTTLTKLGRNGAIVYSVADSAASTAASTIRLVAAGNPVDRTIASGSCPQFASAQSILAYTLPSLDVAVAQFTDGGLASPTILPRLGAAYFVLSPDGTRIAWIEGPSALWVRDVSTGVGRAIVPASSDPGTARSEPTWSPDGRQIAFVAGGSPDWTRSNISIVDADGSHLRVLSSRVAAGFAFSLTWSPDGRFLAYAGMPDDGRLPEDLGTLTTDIFVIGADGTGEHNLTNTPGQETEPVWSPDGHHLAYVGGDGGARLAVVRMDESHAVGPPRLSRSFDSFTWAPDGTKLLVMTTIEPFGGRSISTIDAELGTPLVTVRDTDLPVSCPPAWQRLEP